MNIILGAISPPLKEQLGIDNLKVEHLQKDADAISRLHVRGLLNRTETVNAEKRLMKQIAKVIEEVGK